MNTEPPRLRSTPINFFWYQISTKEDVEEACLSSGSTEKSHRMREAKQLVQSGGKTKKAVFTLTIVVTILEVN